MLRNPFKPPSMDMLIQGRKHIGIAWGRSVASSEGSKQPRGKTVPVHRGEFFGTAAGFSAARCGEVVGGFPKSNPLGGWHGARAHEDGRAHFPT